MQKKNSKNYSIYKFIKSSNGKNHGFYTGQTIKNRSADS